MDASIETIAEAIAEIAAKKTEAFRLSPVYSAEPVTRDSPPAESIVLTGGGANMLYPGLKALLPHENVVLDPVHKRGRARELLAMCKSSIVNGKDTNDSGPLYIRKSDAELSRSNC
jgi:tRNA A37 threonylcarbamoyladenosine modification protein TsaB